MPEDTTKSPLSKKALLILILIVIVGGIVYAVKIYNSRKFKPLTAEQKTILLNDPALNNYPGMTTNEDRLRMMQEFEKSQVSSYPSSFLSAEEKLQILNNY